MDHLSIDKFMVLGYCVGSPFIWNLIKRAPKRVVAAVLTQPSGFRPEPPDHEGREGTAPSVGARWEDASGRVGPDQGFRPNCRT